MDVEHAANLYGQGWTLRQTGAELGVHWAAVRQQLHRAGVSMRRSGPSAHSAATQQISKLRHQGLTSTEVAEQVGMTRSGVWSRYWKARPPQQPRLGNRSRCSRTRLRRILRLVSEQPSLNHLGRAATRAKLTAARRAAHGLAALGRARVLHVPESMRTPMQATATI